MHSAVVYALLAAALFGASTPFAKLLVGEHPPILLAGLLYLGSGTGLMLFRLVRGPLLFYRLIAAGVPLPTKAYSGSCRAG